ncbi:hypothetical protein D3C85_1121440 [compost metagenome]
MFNKPVIDMEFAKEVLTETEFDILATLYNKVEDRRIENELTEIDFFKSLFPFIPVTIQGVPGAGKTSSISSIKKAAEELGFKVFEVKTLKPTIQQIIEEEEAARSGMMLMSEMFNLIMNGKIEPKSQHQLIGEQIIRLKNQGYSDQLITAKLQNAFLSGQDVVEYLKVLE